jgi:TonB-linked SusC/RagA family outer membrane protein
MKSNYLLLYFLLLSTLGFAQSYDIGGTVKEMSTGIPLPGVSIQVGGSQSGTISDLDGNFILSGIPPGSTVTFSYLGFKTYEYVVNSSATDLSISMADDQQALEEVVVIGYGSQKRREVTGAVSTVSAAMIDDIRPVKIEQALQGTMAGVVVTSQSGAPGAGLDIRIRGVMTNGNSAPTAIIDGYVGELGLLNPADIESITVLKDAQAAIYGTIGANGIILVTTKKGRKNSKTAFTYNVYTGFQETSRKIPLLNATEYALITNEAFANGGQQIPFPDVSAFGRGTDWHEVFGKNVPIVSHDFNLRGGSDKIGYSFSGSHLDQEGLVGGEKSGFLRNTARMSVDADVSDKLKVNANVIYTYFTRKTLNENVLGSVLFNALNIAPNLTPFDDNGEHTLVPNEAGYGTEVINPLAQVANTYNDYAYKKLNGTFGFDYEAFKGFTLTSRIGFNTSTSTSKSFAKQVDYGEKIYDVDRSSVTQGEVNDNSYTFDLFANYKRSFADAHNFELTVGTTILENWGNGLYATGYDVPYNSWQFADIKLAQGLSESLTNSSYNYDHARLSYFARLQYNFKERYLLSAMMRRDVSTRFSPEHQVAYFPSVTAGWIISEESFFGNSNVVNFLKLRGSWGTLGNDQIDEGVFLSLLNGEATYVFDDQMVNGVASGIQPNPNAKWESSEKIDIGVDMELFNNKVSFVADYFVDIRHDLLIPRIPVSGIGGSGAPGASAPTVNAGSVKNYGLELAVGYKNKVTDSFSFDVNYNVTFIKNKVLEVNNGTGFFPGGQFSLAEQPSRMEAGHEMGYFYGYKTAGIFQNQDEVDAHPSQIALGANAAPGDLRFVDVNGDGVITAEDKTKLGDPIPNATMGFNLRLNYKAFDFAAYAYASLGNDMVRNYEFNLPKGNRQTHVLDRWTGEGTSNSEPRVTTGATSNTVFSDYYVDDASFLRIQNIQLGYTINNSFLEKAGLAKARIYAGVNNLYTFTKYRGFDPAASSGSPIGSGIDFGFYPVPRTYMLGANINF